LAMVCLQGKRGGHARPGGSRGRAGQLKERCNGPGWKQSSQQPPPCLVLRPQTRERARTLGAARGGDGQTSLFQKEGRWGGGRGGGKNKSVCVCVCVCVCVYVCSEHSFPFYTLSGGKEPREKGAVKGRHESEAAHTKHTRTHTKHVTHARLIPLNFQLAL
jgi:hypothetical protein